MKVHLVMAHDMSVAVAALGRLRFLLLAVGAGIALALALAIPLIVGRALRPLHRVREEIEARDVAGLGSELEGGGSVPGELRPLVSSFNGLLGRIRKTIEREKQFANSAAHELRTPLAGLTSTLELALRRERSAEHYRGTLQNSLRSTEEMNGLVERLLSLSRLGNVSDDEVMETPLAELIDGAVETFREAAESRGLTISVEVSPDLAVRTEPALMQVVINNLVENAVNYAEAGSIIRIAAANGGGSIKLTVDNSSHEALSSEDAERVFEPFWRADAARSATGIHAGLGLSICQRIIELFHGKIHATADDGGQFGVTVELPAAA
jgi:signal transduction histidine kinase